MVDRNGKVIKFFGPNEHPDTFKDFLAEQLAWNLWNKRKTRIKMIFLIKINDQKVMYDFCLFYF